MMVNAHGTSALDEMCEENGSKCPQSAESGPRLLIDRTPPPLEKRARIRGYVKSHKRLTHGAHLDHSRG